MPQVGIPAVGIVPFAGIVAVSEIAAVFRTLREDVIVDWNRLFRTAESSVRLAGGRSVPIPRVFQVLVDHPDVQRLRRVRQLGPIHLVYPGAVHTRFEHSLGVFGAAVGYLEGLSRTTTFVDRVDDRDMKCLLAAALLHDIGHYPFAHSLEAVHGGTFAAPRHEDLAAEMIRGTLQGWRPGQAEVASLGTLIEDGLGVDRHRVADIVQHGSAPHLSRNDRLLASIISSAIDADKLDYLERDSLHMGVSYGRMPDRERLMAGLTVNPKGDRIALTQKGRAHGEIFLFCRYLMFSEAYWHRTVRSASAMIEAALADYLERERPDSREFGRLLLDKSDDELLNHLVQHGQRSDLANDLLDRLTYRGRGMYKRVLTLNRQLDDTDQQRAYEAIFTMDAAGLTSLSARLRDALGRELGREVPIGSLLVDTPPRDKDKMDTVEVVVAPDRTIPLHKLSTVVRGIGQDFVRVVKKIRVFVAPEIRDQLADRLPKIEETLMAEIVD